MSDTSRVAPHLTTADLREVHEEAMTRLGRWDALTDPHDLVSTLRVALSALAERLQILEGQSLPPEAKP